MHDDIRETRHWLEALIARTGLKPTPLAQQAGIAPSTILRALATDNPTTLERRTIRKLCATFGVPPPGQAPGFAEDLAPYDGPSPEDGGGRTLTATSRALDLAGILPGDLLTFAEIAPAAGDIVEARIGADTALRLYDPPYLVTRSTDSAETVKPQLVDGERVRIVAVCTHLARRLRK